jgi:hypothetical protein
VERHSRYLEAEPDDHEDHTEDEQRYIFETRCCSGDAVELLGAGEPIKQRHSEQREGECKHTDDEELDRCLVRLRITLAPANEQECRTRHKFEGNDHRDEVP